MLNQNNFDPNNLKKYQARNAEMPSEQFHSDINLGSPKQTHQKSEIQQGGESTNESSPHLNHYPSMPNLPLPRNQGNSFAPDQLEKYHPRPRSVITFETNAKEGRNGNISIYPQPETDRAMASHIKLKTKFTHLMLFLVALIAVTCLGVIILDSKNQYDVMVMEEQVKLDACIMNYEQNRCHKNQRVPALESYCVELEMCMNSDPLKIAKRTTAFSVLIAENANRLFGTLEMKTILVITGLMVVSILSCNLSFSKGQGTVAYVSKAKQY